MKLTLICVGRPAALLERAIADYEQRARRYWSLDVIEVREERARRSVPEQAVRDAEGERILKRVPKGSELVALARGGDAWNSVSLARDLERHAAHGGAGFTWVIGGAFGLSEVIMKEARRRMQLSTFTLPHDVARLVLLEQVYRAGTILRGEPYHKGGDDT